jgi:polar amino acid transport system substrate-binding protein
MRPLVALFSLLAACSFSAAASEPLKVCLLTHNAPYSEQASNSGFDLATANAVAAEMQRPLEVVWVNNAAKVVELEDSDFPARKLQKGVCDVLFSIPGPARDSLRETPSLALGAPYYGASFQLYGAAGETRRELRQLRDVPVAVQAATVGAFALRLVGAKIKTCLSPEEVLRRAASHEAEMALVWGPAAGAVLKGQRDLSISPVAGYEAPAALAWNEHAATRGKDEALRSAIDAALAKLTSSGRLPQLATEAGIPWHAPFAKTYSLGEMNNLR